MSYLGPSALFWGDFYEIWRNFAHFRTIRISETVGSAPFECRIAFSKNSR